MSYRRLDRPTSWVDLSRRSLRLDLAPKVLSHNKLIIACPEPCPGIGRPTPSCPIQGAANPAPTPVRHVRVNRCAHILVRTLLQVNLLDAVEGQLIERLVTDPVLLCDCVYAICQPEADARHHR